MSVTHFPVMESFYTLQGEGFHSGRAAYFIRIAGCDVGCVWCDVKESWHTEGYPVLSVSEIVDAALQYPGRLAVITGGEPLMYNLNALTEALKKAGFETNIETSGAYPLSGNWDWICLSPKKFKPALPDVFAAANELKVIVYNPSDFEFAEQNADRVSDKCRLYLQPEWSKSEKILPQILAYIRTNPRWVLSLQTHKYLNIP